MKREAGAFLTWLLAYDAKLTKQFISLLLNYAPFQSLKIHCQFLEWSCHGITWISIWLACCWMVNNPYLYEMEINMLLGLLLDIALVAIIKAAVRRRRPGSEEFFGPDKFSFPSGHASRSSLILCFFIYLYPLQRIFFPPLLAWAFAVSLSRLLLNRHHILDVIAGVVLGLFEAFVLNILWLGPETSTYIMTWISEDYVPGGVD